MKQDHELLVLANPVDLGLERVEDDLVDADTPGASNDLSRIRQVLGKSDSGRLARHDVMIAAREGGSEGPITPPHTSGRPRLDRTRKDVRCGKLPSFGPGGVSPSSCQGVQAALVSSGAATGGR